MNAQTWINQHQIIAIVRGVPGDQILPTAKALHDGGIRLLEITFDQSGKTSSLDTGRSIEALARAFEGRMCIGAGTVMTVEQADIAAKAGAQYMISPHSDRAVIEHTKTIGSVSIPGAMTPSEIVQAYQWGADFVKLFPAGTLGEGYIKAIRAPISHIPLLAVGGIDELNLNRFLSLGLSGVGIGSNLVNLKLIREGRFDELTRLAEKFRVKEQHA